MSHRGSCSNLNFFSPRLVQNCIAGSCDEGSDDAFIEELLASPPCKQRYTSSVQIQTTDDASSEALIDLITEAFNSAVKPALESKEGVVAVAIGEINEEIDQASAVDAATSESSAQGRRNNRTVIIACSIVGACVFVCIVLLLLISIYEKRLRTSYAKSRGLRKGPSGHRKFEDEYDYESDDSEDSSQRELVHVGSHKITVYTRNTPSDESTSTVQEIFEEDHEAILADLQDIPPPIPEEQPCHILTYTPNSPAPFDENPSKEETCSAATCGKCENQRQKGVDGIAISPRRTVSSMIRAIDSSEPANVNMEVTPSTVTLPRIERHPLIMSANKSRRKYIHSDEVEL